MRRRRKLPPPGPPPPPSDYVNVLGSKLRLLFRAPSGVYGNDVLAQRWTDEVTGLVLPEGFGDPTLEKDGANFGRKSVVRLNASPATRFLQETSGSEIVAVGESPELFAVFRASTLDAANRRLLVLSNAGLGILVALSTGVNTLAFTCGGTTSTAFTDTNSVHLVTGRTEVVSGSETRIISIDGVDVTSALGSAAQSRCDRVFIGSGSTSFDGYVGMCGFVNPPMTTEERAEFVRIARAEWGF